MRIRVAVLQYCFAITCKTEYALHVRLCMMMMMMVVVVMMTMMMMTMMIRYIMCHHDVYKQCSW